MRSRLWLVLVLLIVFLVPSNAIAEERTVDDRQTESEEIVLRAGPPTPISEIRNWFYNVRVSFMGASFRFQQLVNLPRRLLINGDNQRLLLVPALGLVFILWGVRKAIRIIFRAFRKGKMNA